jgi:hypothetical protein
MKKAKHLIELLRALANKASRFYLAGKTVISILGEFTP